MTYPPNPGYQPPSGNQPQQPNPYDPTRPGHQPPPYGYPSGYGYVMIPPQPEQGMAIASLVCSLVGILLCLPAIVGIVFGHVGYSKAKRGEAGGEGMALAGMIIGYVVCGLWLIPLFLWVGGVAFLGVAGLY